MSISTSFTAPATGGLLHHIDDQFGGAVAYLRAHGLSPSDLDSLEARLTVG
jgi:hypothetical protein